MQYNMKKQSMNLEEVMNLILYIIKPQNSVPTLNFTVPYTLKRFLILL